MLLALLAGGLALLALPWAARRLGRRLDPAEWSRLCSLALAAGGAVLELAVVLVAAPTVLRAVGVPEVAAACERMLAPLAPGGPVAGWSAAALAVAIPGRGLLGVMRARRSHRTFHIEGWLGEHTTFGAHELVVLPTDQPLALTVDGHVPQIIVSEGLVAALADEELDAVLRHEAAHLRHHHQRHLLLATALEHGFVFLPFVRRSATALRAALERWADEEAAGETREARSAVRDALLGVTRALVAPAVVATFSAADTVIERLDALEGAPPHPSRLRRAALYIPGLAVGALVLVALGAWAGEVSTMLAMTGRCPT